MRASSSRSPLSSLLAGAFAASVVIASAACGNRAEPAAPTSAAAPASLGSTPAAPSAPPAAEPEPPPRPRKPFEIHSACADVTTIVFGEDPKAAGAGRRTLAENSSLDGPRDEKGNMTVWLLDAKGEPIANVHVTRGMKRLEIGRSCRTLDAR